MKPLRIAALIVLPTLGSGLSSVAAAAVALNLADTVTRNNDASTQTYVVTPSSLASNGTIDPTTTLTLGDAFNGSGQVHTGLDFGSAATGPGGPWNFQDDFVFSTDGATIYTAIISLPSFSTTGLTDLQARIIYATDSTGNPINSAPTLGPPQQGTLVDSWQTLNFSGGSYTATMPKGFAGGSYILQVRGEVAAGGGSYGGTIAFTPVPLPATLPLLISGLGALGALARKRCA